MTVKDAALVGIYGARGSGKTTLTLSLLRDRPRVVAFDPTGEYSREHGFKEFRTGDGAAMRRYLARHWSGRFRVAYVPSGNEVPALHGLCAFLLRCQSPYLDGRDGRKLTLVVEEMNLGFPSAALPNSCQAMPVVCNQGRHYGIDVFGVTQRPAQVSTMFRGNAAESYVFRLAWADDRAPILKMIGAEHGPALAALQAHEFLHLAGGRVTAGRNPPLRRRRA